MKKTLVALAVLAASGASMAQSTVTLYGLADIGVGSYKSNASIATGSDVVRSFTQTRMDAGGYNGSRFGMKGSEDLGGGLSAIFNFEAGFNLDTGTSGQGALFGRRANVGIASASFGKVELGRNSSSYDDVAADHAMMLGNPYDPSNTNNSIAALNVASISATKAATALVTRDAPSTWIGYQTRFNNSVKYTSNVYSGFSGSVMYAMGEDKTSATTTPDSTSSTALYVKYNQGPLLASFGYQTESAGGTLASTNGNTTTAKPALENTLVSVAYDFGMAKLGVGFNTAKYKDVTITSTAGNAKDPSQNEYDVSVAMPFGATTVRAAYAVSQGDTFGKASGYGLSAEYAMSKRTFLYTGYNSTDLWDNYVNLANTQAGADVQKITRFSVGVQHKF